MALDEAIHRTGRGLQAQLRDNALTQFFQAKVRLGLDKGFQPSSVRLQRRAALAASWPGRCAASGIQVLLPTDSRRSAYFETTGRTAERITLRNLIQNPLAILFRIRPSNHLNLQK